MTFAISAVSSRLHLVEALTAQLPDARVYVDDPPSGSSWPNYRRALLEAEGDWLVKVDDDVILCQGFAHEVSRALTSCPGNFCEFWFGPKTLDRVDADGASWLATAVVYGLAWAIRVPLARQAAAFGDGVDAHGSDRLRAWLTATGRPNFITIPNLADHHPEEASLLWGRPNAGNGSPRFAADPSSVVWSRRIAVPRN